MDSITHIRISRSGHGLPEFQKSEVIPLAGPTNAAIAYK
jgi:hypothetical protein